MKLCGLLVLLGCVCAAFGSFAPSLDDDLHNLERGCASRSGVTTGQINEARSQHQIDENDPQMNQFAKCMMENFNVMTPDGAINGDVYSYRVPSDTDEIFRAGAACKKINATPDTLPAKLMNCMLRHNQIVLAFGPL